MIYLSVFNDPRIFFCSRAFCMYYAYVADGEHHCKYQRIEHPAPYL